MIDGFLDVMEEHRALGLQRGSQLVVLHNGNVVADLADGEASDAVPMTGAHVMRWYEAGMPQLSALVMRLVERGKLDLDDPVSKYVGDWGNGKEACTIRHLLTHMGRFPGAELSDRDVDHDDAVRLIGTYRAESAPGRRAGFHPSIGWRILAEILIKVEGRTLKRQLHTELWKPLGMPRVTLGLMVKDRHRLGALLAPVHWAGYSVDERDEDNIVNRVPFRADLIHNTAWHQAKMEPATGWFGTARDLAKFYLGLSTSRHRLDKGRQSRRRVFSQPSTLDLMTAAV